MPASMIQSIMTTDIISLSRHSYVKDAVDLMSTNDISCVLIVEDEKPIGIITERDILKLATKNKNIESLQLEEHMTCPIKTINKDMDFYEASRYLEENKIRRIVMVNEEGKLVGLVTQTDLKNHLGAEFYVKLKTIESVITKKVITAGYEDSTGSLIQKMGRHNISCLVICENGIPKGIITERDITRLIAKTGNPSDIPAKEVVKNPLITVLLETTIYEAAQIMRKKKIRRLVVVNEKNRLIGLISESDIVKHIEIDHMEFLRCIMEKDREYINTIKEGILECTPGIEGTITWINRSGARVLGYESPNKVIGKKFKDFFVDPQDLETLINILNTNEIAKDFSSLLKKADDKHFYAEGTFYFARDDNDSITFLEGTLRDVTERKKLEQQLRQYASEMEQKVKERTRELRQKNKELKEINAKLQKLSHQDGLTGINNFRYMSELLEIEFKKSNRYKLPLSCMILDIDNFKSINDRFGHTVGDMALIKTAQLIHETIRDTDVLARYGGDEFTIILPNTSLEHAYAVGNKILGRFKEYELWQGKTSIGKISLSIGVSAFQEEKTTDHQKLLECADKAMYFAKEHGKNRVCMFNPNAMI